MNGPVLEAKPEEPLLDSLRGFLRKALEAEALEITGLHRASYGFSRENWPFDLRWRGGNGVWHCENFILRRDPLGSVLETDRETEFRLLVALEGLETVPTPVVRWLDANGAMFGRPSVVMVRHDGVCDPFVLSGGALKLSEAQRMSLAHQFMDAVAAIHGADWRALGLDRLHPVPAIGTCQPALAALAHWEGELRRVALEPLPELEFVLAWLRAHVPHSDDVTLVHGDFKPGNTLVVGDRLARVLDWETAHLGDPHEDLGWVTNPMRASEHQIAGLWQQSDMLSYYAKQTGRIVYPERVRWWNVLANFKLATITLTGVNAFLDERWDRVIDNRIYALDVMMDLIGAKS